MEELNDEELLLYFESCEEKSFHHRWERFALEKFSEEECLHLFRFSKEHLPILQAILRINDEWKGSNGLLWSGMEGMCIVLRRLAYPNRLVDMVPIFARHPTELSLIFNTMLKFIYEAHIHLITDLDQPWLQHEELVRYAHAVHGAGAPVTNCWGFIDGTVMPICRPTHNQ